MKDKKNIVFLVLLLAFSVLALSTMFMPYIKLAEEDIVDAFQEVFEEFEYDSEEYLESDGEEWIGSKSGVGIVDSLVNLKYGKNIKQVKTVKNFVLGCLFASWILGVATIVVSIVLKKKARYITILVLSLASTFSMLSIFLFLPNVAKNAIVVGVEDQLGGDGDIVDSVVAESLRDTIVEWVGEFVRIVLNNALTFGYWLSISFMAVVVIVSIVGLVLDGKAVKALLTVLSGEYKGATVDVDSNIIVGRDPKLCQLVLNGDQISRKHCKVSFNSKTGKYLVTDYSTNGTYYENGKRLDENVTSEIEAGTIIQLGNKGIKLKLG